MPAKAWGRRTASTRNFCPHLNASIAGRGSIRPIFLERSDWFYLVTRFRSLTANFCMRFKLLRWLTPSANLHIGRSEPEPARLRPICAPLLSSSRRRSAPSTARIVPLARPGLSGATPGNCEYLSIHRESVPARLRIQAHARLDSLEHSAASQRAQSVAGDCIGASLHCGRANCQCNRGACEPDAGTAMALAEQSGAAIHCAIWTGRSSSSSRCGSVPACRPRLQERMDQAFRQAHGPGLAYRAAADAAGFSRAELANSSH
jgi:hypothetical protein